MSHDALLRVLVEDAWQRRDGLTAAEIDQSLRPAIGHVIKRLEDGALRVAEPSADGWTVNQWLKKAVLLYFKFSANAIQDASPAPYWDKIPQRFEGFDADAVISGVHVDCLLSGFLNSPLSSLATDARRLTPFRLLQCTLPAMSFPKC